MPDTPDFFREFGILPYGKAAPPEKVRASFSRGTIVGQYIATALMSGFGLGVTALFAFTLPFPFNLLAALVAVAAFGYVVYFATRNDYAWIELENDVLRAKHLYTRRMVERPIEDIEDLLTLVIQVRTVAVRITEAWLGRIRGIEIRFQDKRAPLRVSRSDPAMKNAKELVEALIYRMGEKAPVEAEIIDLRGKPLVRRIFWKDGPP
jgi:signal transduction histidine kinase